MPLSQGVAARSHAPSFPARLPQGAAVATEACAASFPSRPAAAAGQRLPARLAPVAAPLYAAAAALPVPVPLPLPLCLLPLLRVAQGGWLRRCAAVVLRVVRPHPGPANAMGCQPSEHPQELLSQPRKHTSKCLQRYTANFTFITPNGGAHVCRLPIGAACMCWGCLPLLTSTMRTAGCSLSLSRSFSFLYLFTFLALRARSLSLTACLS